MLDNEDQPLNTVPEVWLRKRKQVDKQNIINKRQQKEHQRQQKKSLRTEFTRADTLIRKRKQVIQESRPLQKVQRQVTKNALKDNQMGKLLLVVRSDTVANGRNIHKKVLAVLKDMGLEKIHSAVFVRSSPALHEKLQQIRPYVATGSPSLETVRNLINKRAHTLVKGKRVPVSDNTMVEEALGDAGVICVEDIIHEIMNGDDETFDKVVSYLTPFELNKEVGNKNKVMMKKLTEQSEGDRPRVNKDIDTFVGYYN